MKMNYIFLLKYSNRRRVLDYTVNLLCDPEALSGLDPEKTAHLCIDVQEYYFKGKGDEAEAVARTIAHIAPLFNEAGLNETLYVYHTCAGAHFFIVDPKKEEVFQKDHFSAFNRTNLDEHLKSRNVKNIVLSGGYISQCVALTAKDALEREYRVFVMADAIFDPGEFQEMRLKDVFTNYSYKSERQVSFTTSGAILQKFYEFSPVIPRSL